jgi:ribonucleoside-triphosphate reductase
MALGGGFFQTIIKRDGSEAPFDAGKIVNAVAKAGEATGEFDEAIAKKLAVKALLLSHDIFGEEPPTVEGVQDVVEEVLLNSPYSAAAKAYIIYREQRARVREIASKGNVDLVDQYLQKADWRVKENSNMSYSLQGLNNYVASEISKTYWLNSIYPAPIRDAHVSGDLHIHDLGLLSVYCVGWDLYDLLTQGFKGVSGKVEASPAKHFRTALGQIVNFFYTLQGEAAGAQAFGNFDTLLAPFIRRDRLTYDEVKQATQEFIFNVNVPTRVGFQTPFSNVTLDLVCPAYFRDQPAIVGGEPQKETYGEFGKEMEMFNRALLEVMAEGDAKGRVFTFPIPTYNIGEDFDWDDPNLEPLWEATAKYGIPYFANFVNSDMDPEDARSMCCRLRIDNRELNKRGGGLFGSAPLTGSIGVVTINLPRLGYVAKDEEEFRERLGAAMDLARDSLEIKRKTLERFTERNLYPYMSFYLRDIRKRFGEYWKNHFSTIGLLGMNEACLNLFGDDIVSPEGRAFAARTLDFMRERLVEYQEETGAIFNLEATPAEGTAYRLARLDKSRHPAVIAANEADDSCAPYYTNSSQLPVGFTDDIFEMLDLQDDLQTKYTGGTVLHLYLGERVRDAGAVKRLIRKVCENYRLPYFSITPTFSVCPECGYLDGERRVCDCGKQTEVYSRVVGYLRPVEQWNEGKREEFRERKMYRIEGDA